MVDVVTVLKETRDAANDMEKIVSLAETFLYVMEMVDGGCVLVGRRVGTHLFHSLNLCRCARHVGCICVF
jgi:hypothetical protein